MTRYSRREVGLGIGATLAGTGAAGSFAIAQGAAKIVIIGGGPGGATVAHQLKQGDAALDVTLIEASATYTTCFFSNLYLGGFRTYQSLQHNYDGLKKLGVKVVVARATDVDQAARTVRAGGRSYPYDRLVVAPGIEIKYGSIEGYSEQASQLMPHAYLPGAQTQLLKRQLVHRFGPLPAEIQNYTTYSVGLGSAATDPEAAKAFIRALTGPAAAGVLKSKGMEGV